MAKPDWGALQDQFLAKHAKTGISPKEWCEAQGLNYTSARRYIKKPAAQCADDENRGKGRPSAYKTEYAELAKRLCMLGFTDSELATAMGVSEPTINAWKKKYPEFLKALKTGKLIADADVAAKLFHRATGYEHPEDDIRAIDGRVVITPTIKHYPPDTAAAIFWLKNRQRDKWRDKQEIEHSGEVNLVDRIQAARKRARGQHDK